MTSVLICYGVYQVTQFCWLLICNPHIQSSAMIFLIINSRLLERSQNEVAGTSLFTGVYPKQNR